MDRELEDFKSRVDLREYAASVGYELDRRESSRSSAVMRHAGDKIVVKRNPNGHFVYFSVRDDADNGTILDFAQRRKGLNLGQVRKELRPWIGRPVAPLPLFSKLEASAKDRQAVERAYSGMQIALRHPYLEQERKLPPGLLGAPRFAGRIRMDAHGNAVFPHFDKFGLCGYELKNKEFTGFAKGGEKGLWESHDQDDDTAIVFAESAIDTLSYAVLFPEQTARYRSVGGTVNAEQPHVIKSTIAALPAGGTVICATDNDATGRKLAAMVEDCLQKADRPDLHYKLDLPLTEGEDWNQVLQTTPSLPSANSFPIAHPAPR